MRPMADPLRPEEIALRDGRKVIVRSSRLDDVERILENINLVCKEEIYLMMDEVPWDLERERRWLSGFDGERNVLFVAQAGDALVGQVDCRQEPFPKARHVGVIGIAIRDGWREAGLGRILMLRVLEWMRSRGFLKAELAVFATNARAKHVYESLGFRVEGVRSRHQVIRGEYVDEVLMGLWLGSEEGIKRPSRGA